MIPKEVTDREMQLAQLLLQFIEITKDGMTKPYDPSPVVKKIIQIESTESCDLTDLKNCCSTVAEIRDSKDFKPYTLAAVRKFAEIMQLKVEDQSYGNRY